MPYISDLQTIRIKNALAIILRASFNKEEDSRILIARQVGRIGKLFPKIKVE